MIGAIRLTSDTVLTLSVTLVDWEDVDYAGYVLAQALGLFPDETFGEVKWVFDMDNPLSRILDQILTLLVEARVLDRRDDEGKQFRWRVVGPGYELARG
jgi:hypothetical protein